MLQTPHISSREPELPQSLRSAGRAYAYFQGKHSPNFIQSCIREANEKPRWLGSLKWFIENYRHFCRLKSEIISFIVIVGLPDIGLTELWLFIDSFPENYWRELDRESLMNLKAIIESEILFRTNQGENTDCNALMSTGSSALADALSRVVSDIQVRPYWEIEKMQKKEERRVAEKEKRKALELKREARNYLKRLERRYEHIRKNYNIETNQTINPEDSVNHLNRWFDVHCRGVDWNEDDFMFPDFDDMWTSIDDANAEIANLLLIMNAILDTWVSRFDIESYISTEHRNSSSRKLALSHFVGYVFYKELERRKDFEAEKARAHAQLNLIQWELGDMTTLIHTIRERLNALTIRYI